MNFVSYLEKREKRTTLIRFLETFPRYENETLIYYNKKENK